LRSYFREKAPHFSGIRSAITFQNLQAINFPLGCESLHAFASSVVEQGWMGVVVAAHKEKYPKDSIPDMLNVDCSCAND